VARRDLQICWEHVQWWDYVHTLDSQEKQEWWWSILVRKFYFERTNKRPWETIQLAVLTVLEDWLPTFQTHDVSACLGQWRPGTSWMPRSLQQWSMMIKHQRRTHERLQCGRASVSSWNYHINITTKSGTNIIIIISIVKCDHQTFQSFPTTFISNLNPTRYNSQTMWKHVHKLFKNRGTQHFTISARL